MSDTIQQPFQGSQLDARSALEQYRIDQHFAEIHAAATTPGALEAASLDPGTFLDQQEVLDPRYFDAMQARYSEPSATERLDGAQVVEQPATTIERQIEALTFEQQRNVIADTSRYIASMRAYNLQVTAIEATISQHKKPSFFQKALELLAGPSDRKARSAATSERQLIEQENQIGKEVFGEIPADHRRDFFCLDEHTWVWHEEWIDGDNKHQVSTTRYEVQPNGILKVQSGRVYKYIDGEELQNLTIAVRLYYENVMRDIYHFDPLTGKPLQAVPATIR